MIVFEIATDSSGTPEAGANPNGSGCVSSTAIEKTRLTVCPLASVAFTVKPNDPVLTGVPAISPAAESVSPGGSAPAVTSNEMGGVPPDAASVPLYGEPVPPDGRSEAVTKASGEAVVLRNVPETLPMVSVVVVVVDGRLDEMCRAHTDWPGLIVPAAEAKLPVQPIEYVPLLTEIGTETW